MYNYVNLRSKHIQKNLLIKTPLGPEKKFLYPSVCYIHVKSHEKYICTDLKLVLHIQVFLFQSS